MALVIDGNGARVEYVGLIPPPPPDETDLDVVSIRQYDALAGMKGDVDVSAAFRAAEADLFGKGKTLFLPNGVYFMGPASPGADYAFINRDMSIRGESQGGVQIITLPSVNDPAFRIMRVRPTTRVFFMRLANFSMNHNSGAFINGPPVEFDLGLAVDPGAGRGLHNLEVENVSFGSASDVSMRCKNDDATNIQGLPAIGVFRQCEFGTGMDLDGIGDSVTFENCTVGRKRGATGTVPVGTACVFRTVAGAGGTSGDHAFRNMNTTGAWRFRNGRSLSIGPWNIEGFAPGNSNGAFIDFDGDLGRITALTVEGITFGGYDEGGGVASDFTRVIRVNKVDGCRIGSNELAAGKSGIPVGVEITAEATLVNDPMGPLVIGAGYVTPILGLGANAYLGVPTSGTFTPTITFATPGDLSVAYTLQRGRYRRQGDRIFFDLRVGGTATFSTATGEFRIPGLPQPIASGAVGGTGGLLLTPCTLGSSAGVYLPAGQQLLSAFAPSGTSHVAIAVATVNPTAGALGTVGAGNIASGAAFSFAVSGSYFIG